MLVAAADPDLEEVQRPGCGFRVTHVRALIPVARPTDAGIEATVLTRAVAAAGSLSP